MNPDTGTELRSLRTIAGIAGLLASALGIVALVGWVTGQSILATFAADRIPMAPSTALLFLVFGALAALGPSMRYRRGVAAVATAIGAAATVTATVLLVTSLLGFTPTIEHLGLTIAGSVSGAPVGHMSPLTAACFVLAGAAFLLTHLGLDPGWRAHKIALVFSVLLLLASIVLITAYLLGGPLLYGSGTIPPALSTSIGFLTVGTALLATAGRAIGRVEETGSSTPTRPPYTWLAAVVILACAIVASAYLYFRSYQRQFQREIESELSAVADLKTHELVQWRAERLGDGSLFHLNSNISDLTDRYLRSPDDTELSQSLQIWLDKVRRAHDYRQLVLLDADGRTRMSSPTTAGFVWTHTSDSVQSIIDAGEVRFLDFHRHGPSEPVVLSVLVPILDDVPETGGLGLLILEIDPGHYLYPTIQSWPTMRATAETLLVRRDGDDVLFLNDLRFHDDAAMRLRIPLTNTDLPAAMVLQGAQGIVEGNDYRGIPVVAAVRSIPDSPWSIVAKIDADEIYLPLRRHLGMVLGVVAILLASVIAALAVVWQRRAKAHYRALYEAETRYATTLRSIGDGVIATDEAGHITLLNPVAEKLTGWSALAARGRPLSEVFRIINEYSRAPVVSPVDRVLQEGVVVGLANHTLLITRDSREVPIADSGAPITDPGGGITGVVLIFRDQTEERAAQRRLEAEKARAQQYLNIAGVMILALDQEGEVTLINRRGAEILGYPEDEIVGENWFDRFLPRDEAHGVQEALKRVMLGDRRQPTEIENAILTSSGERRLIIWRNAVIRDNQGMPVGLLASGADITARRQAEESLRRIEWMLNPDRRAAGGAETNTQAYSPRYGDLLLLNQGGEILTAVGRDMLESIVRDYLDLLDTSAAIYESNGDYALGIFASGWCQLMDHASRQLCDSDDNAAALASGDWLCHESCWHHAAEAAMRIDGPVDVACLGGIRLYAVPIHAGNEIVGAMNFGYGDPPTDVETLHELAQAFGLDLAELRASAEDYETRPPFIIDLAKRRIEASAQLIGEIVSRKRAADALRASEAALNRAQRVAHVGSWTWHIASNELVWSDEMYRIFGIDRDSFTGHLPDVIAQAIHPEDRSAVEASNRSVVEARVPIPLEYRVVRPDGTIRTVWAEAGDLAVDDDGRPAVLTGIVQDITERKASEVERQALIDLSREQAQQISQLLETVPQGVLLLDADGHVQLANAVAASQLQLLAGIEPYGFDALVVPLTSSGPATAAAPSGAGARPKLQRLGDRALSQLLTSPPHGMWHEVHADGRTFEVIARPIADGAKPERWVLVIQDVTQERQVREQLQQQERLAAVGQLAAGIAHDFNNIMGVIVLHAQMAARSETLSRRDRERIETIDHQAHHAAELIEQILDFSRRGALERRPLDLLPLVKEQARLLQRTLPEHISVELLHEPEPQAYIVDGDPTRMRQVLMNLAVNARDAMPSGGTLRLSLSHLRLGTRSAAPVANMAPGGWVTLAVSDTGIGISAEALPHIFEPFYTTKGPGQGSGLGLAQVHGIVAQHDGHIDVQTETGNGTTITIYLPAATVSGTPTETTIPDTTPLGHGQVILVVEDNVILRHALSETLTMNGYEVREAPNGQVALALLAEDATTIDLIVSDVVMPQMGGFALAHALREQGWDIPVILMSGHPRQRNLDELQSQGIVDWLPKPPDLNNLTRAVATALRSRR